MSPSATLQSISDKEVMPRGLPPPEDQSTVHAWGGEERQIAVREIAVAGIYRGEQVEATITFVERPPEWSQRALQKLVGFLGFQENWDSYGAAPINLDAVKAATDLLFTSVDEKTAEPAVVPTPRGGIQLEWHINRIDLEVELEPEGRIHVMFDNQRGVKEWDLRKRADLDALVKIIKHLNA